MPRMQFGLDAFERALGDLPELPVYNMFAEQAPTEGTGVVLQSRPGLADRLADMGAGPVRQVFKHDGVLDSGLYGVSDGALYRGTTSLGAVDGTGPVSMAGYEDKLFIAAGASLWGYDGATLAAVAIPDSANVRKVVVGGSRAIIIRDDTEKFYWSDVLSDTIDSLSFATAESQPDRLRDMLFLDDVLLLFGAETVEFWPNGSDPDLPFQPLEGRVFERGVKATGCVTQFASTFAWVTDTNQVCLSDPDNIVSKPGLEALIAASTETALFSFYLEGTEFLALRIDAGTWVYSYRSRLWSNFATYGAGNWEPQCFSGGVFGSATDGNTFAFGTDYSDDGPLERRFRAGLPLNSGGVTLNNIVVRCNIGQTPYLSGDYMEPVLELRLSRDAGQTWGNWRSASLGRQGDYRKKVQFTGLGMFGQPGLLAEFRTTAPVPFRISDILANEPFGGI